MICVFIFNIMLQFCKGKSYEASLQIIFYDLHDVKMLCVGI